MPYCGPTRYSKRLQTRHLIASFEITNFNRSPCLQSVLPCIKPQVNFLQVKGSYLVSHCFQPCDKKRLKQSNPPWMILVCLAISHLNLAMPWTMHQTDFRVLLNKNAPSVMKQGLMTSFNMISPLKCQFLLKPVEKDLTEKMSSNR